VATTLRTAAAPAPLRTAAAISRMEAAITRCLRHPRYVLASCDTCRAAQTARLTARR